MVTQSALLHLRIPFSFFLMPVFWFALSVAPRVDITGAVMSFLILHLLVYPASNGFNSYFDKDEESIGGLEKPPPVSADLLRTSLFMDALGTLMAFFVSWQFGLAVILYGLASKAYSYDKIRLKKYPLISLLTIGIFQGGLVFLAVYQAATGATLTELFDSPRIYGGALLNTAMLLGSYPMTQVYQHREDARRGDLTMSRILGIRGTFLYTGTLYSLVTAGFVFYYLSFFSLNEALLFLAALGPVLIFFLYWFSQVWINAASANFKNTMRINFISSVCTNAFFLFSFIQHHF